MADSSIVGRRREIERLARAIENAGEGAGSLWFLTGEAGIGKSRLAEEVARLARVRGMRTFWGRCWEAGGAPAFWPWVQVLRAILRTARPGELDTFLPQLAQMLPELRETHAVSDVAEVGPEQARFDLMDTVGHVLSNVAADCPTVVILEDLHVADVSTVLLLDFLAASVRNQALLVVGTFRETELANATSGARLLRTAQQGQRLALQRLSIDDIVEFLGPSDDSKTSGLAESLHRITEGHPLFLVEVGRLWQSQGARDQVGRPSIPNSVRHAIHERLDGLSSNCALALRRGALVGREFDAGLLEASHPDASLDYVQACQEATEASVLTEVAPQRYRFQHFLIRELVYGSIPEPDRSDGHRRLAEALRARPPKGAQPAWSEVAHHFGAAGPGCASRAADAYRRASRQALTQLAFEEAVDAASQALRSIERATPIDDAERVRILIELAHAQSRSGDIPRGKATAERSAAAARALGDASLFAEAALEHGSALIIAQVDDNLIRLLEEALRLLDESDGPLRARVMARLAAALQPSMKPRPAIDLARNAIEMARRVGDRSALLDTLRNAGSAMVDLADPEERLAFDREHAALAEELANPSEALRANVRSFMDFAQLGRLDDAFRTLHACERAAEQLRHPVYRWRCRALHALRTLWEGNLDDAENHIAEVRRLGEASGDPNAQSAHDYQRMRLLQLRGDTEGHLQLVDTVERWWRGTEFGDATADVFAGNEYLVAGRTRLALDRFDPKGIQGLVRTSDTSLALGMARLAAAAEDEALAEYLLRAISLSKEHLVTSGMLGATIDGPGSWALGILSRCVGRNEDARDFYEHAILKARRTGGRPMTAWISCELAEMLLEGGRNEDRTRAQDLVSSATGFADALAIPWIQVRAQSLAAKLDTKKPDRIASDPAGAGGHFRIERDGDSWAISHDSRRFHLKDMKGVRLIAQLVASPRREYHVLDLSSDGKASPNPIDGGDAGEVLDNEARRQYQARASSLRKELEEAESWNDAARAERLQEELRFLEQELRQALGLGGRARRAGSAAEKARINVQRRIRDAIRRIESHDPRLAKHLDQSIKTGMYCCYDP